MLTEHGGCSNRTVFQRIGLRCLTWGVALSITARSTSPKLRNEKNSCPRWSNIHVYHHYHHHSQARNEIWESSIYLVGFINLRKKGKMIICWKWKILQRTKLTYLWTILSRGWKHARRIFFLENWEKEKRKKIAPFRYFANFHAAITFRAEQTQRAASG